MNRRHYLSLIGSSTALAIDNGWVQQPQPNENGADNRRPALKQFLVSQEALSDSYTVDLDHLDADDERIVDFDGAVVLGRSTQKPWNKDEWARYQIAHRRFAETQTVDGETIQRSLLQTMALKPRDYPGDQQTTRDDLHKLVLWDWYDGDPGTDHVTDWVERKRYETETPHRRTDVWDRTPILTHGEASKAFAPNSGRPFEEAAVAVAFTDWGVLALEHDITCPSNRRQSLRTVQRLMNRLQNRAKNTPTPVARGVEPQW